MFEGLMLKGKPATCDLQTFNRIRVVPRRPSFVPDVDEGFFVLLWSNDCGTGSMIPNFGRRHE
jgi:hypothetical protein